MFLVQIALVLIIVFVSAYSVVGYQRRLRRAQRTAKQTREELPSLRQLDSRELDALRGQLIDPTRSDRTLELDGNEVYRLSGPFERHGLDTGGHTTWHDQIGGVEVILPYDAALFLKEYNEAEVAFSGRYAVVISLNGEFDLQGGKERQQRREAQEDQWEAGVRGALKCVFGNDGPVEDGSPRQDIRILDQRLETPAETEDREGRGIGFLSSMAWIGSFIALAIAAGVAGEIARQIWVTAAGILALLGLWLFWRPYRPGMPARVNRVSGPLDIFMVPAPNGGPDQGQPALGDRLPFSVPPHWFHKLGGLVGRTVEADIRVMDRSAVRLNHDFSIDAEMIQSRPHYWGKHLSLTLVALGAVVTMLLNSPGPIGDMVLAQHVISGHEIREYHDSQSLAENPPRQGDLVSLSGQAHCQVETPSSNQVAGLIDCSRIRWDGELLPNEPDALPDHLRMLAQGDFLDVRELSGVEQMLVGGHGRREIRVISNPGHAVNLVEQACSDAEREDRGNLFSRRCQDTRRLLLSDMILDMEEAPESWDGVHDLFQTADGDEVRGLMLRDNLERFYLHGRDISNHAILDYREVLAESILDRQRGGILLEVTNGGEAELPSVQHSRRELIRWNELLKLTQRSEAQPFRLEGMVTRLGEDASGAVHLQIDASRSLDESWPALMRSTWLSLGLLLLLIHVPLFAIKLRAARRRGQQLTEQGNQNPRF